MLLHRATDAQTGHHGRRIGPFWDANETWLVLGVGILLIAFPKAHGMVLGALYLPVALMLVGLMLRGVAFDFRVKAQAAPSRLWNRVLRLGPGGRAQGWMLGRYITGLQGWTLRCLPRPSRCCCRRPMCCWAPAGWCMKTEGALQRPRRRLGAAGLVAGGAGHGPDLAGHAGGQRHGARALVRDARVPACCRSRWSPAALLGARGAAAAAMLGRWCWLPFALVVACSCWARWAWPTACTRTW
jgi:cytochrome d ubiquinol oxidase subunit II